VQLTAQAVGGSGRECGVPVTGRLARGEAPVGFRSEGCISQAPPLARTFESIRRGTKAHESWPTWQQGGSPPIRSSQRPDLEWHGRRKLVVLRSTRKRGTRWRSARVAVTTLPREGREWSTVQVASSRSSGRGPSGGSGRQGQGGAGCRREGARARRSAKRPSGCGAGLVAGARKRSWGAWWAGSPPDGDAWSSIDSAYRRILGSRTQASVFGSREKLPRWLSARRHTRHRVRPCRVCRREEPNPEPWWSKLWRARIPGEHRRAASPWPGYEVVAERTPEGSKASKWACRSFTGEPSVSGKGTARAARSGGPRRPD